MKGLPPLPPRTTAQLEARNRAIRKLSRRRPRNNPPHHVGHALQRAATENA